MVHPGERGTRRVGGQGEHGLLVAADVTQELGVRGDAVRRRAGAGGGDGDQLEAAAVHATADGQVQPGPGLGDVGPAGEEGGVVGHVAPRPRLLVLPLREGVRGVRSWLWLDQHEAA